MFGKEYICLTTFNPPFLTNGIQMLLLIKFPTLYFTSSLGGFNRPFPTFSDLVNFFILIALLKNQNLFCLKRRDGIEFPQHLVIL